jgi:hypothetical protein
MKQVTINIKDNKYRFFLELIKNLEFVEIQEESDSKEDIEENIINGFKDLKEYKKGNLKTTNANDFLNEL